MKKISETVAYDTTKAVKRIARERVGQPRSGKILVPKKKRNRSTSRTKTRFGAESPCSI
jgi:hypothetical protein